MRSRSSQAGNMLFLILLAVALFSALSYTVANGFRGGGDRISQQRVQALANDIILSAANAEKGVQRLQTRGVSESRISFEASGLTGYTLSPVASESEKVFAQSGGGANYLVPPVEALDQSRSAEAGYGAWLYTGTNRVLNIGTHAAAASSVELVAILPYIRKDVCVALNKILGMGNLTNGNPPALAGAADVVTKFSGTYLYYRTLLTGVVSNSGKKAACVEGLTNHAGVSIAGRYYFYYVLLPR